MDYTNISTLLKWAEQPDSQAGLFLQPEELAAVDTALGSLAAVQQSVTTVTGERDAHAVTIGALQAQINTLTGEKQSLTGERDALQVKVEALGKKSSGNGSVTKPAATPATETDVPFHATETPWNIAADKAVAMHKAKAAAKGQDED